MTDVQPSEMPAAAPKPVLHLRKPGNAANFVSSEPPVPVRSAPPPPRVQAKTGRAALGWAGYTQPAAWALFLILGGLMAGIRYGGLWHLRHEFILYGPIVVLALYLVIVGLAFNEDLFSGTLCLLIPGYGFYYLVTKAGRPFFTAIVFGLLAGLGEDAFAALSQISLQYYDQVTEWVTGTRR